MRQNPPAVPSRAEEYRQTPMPVLHAIDSYVADDQEYWDAFIDFLTDRTAMSRPVKTAREINALIDRLRRVDCREREISLLRAATAHHWKTVPMRMCACRTLE